MRHQRRLEAALRDLEEAERRLLDELEKVNRQVAYYDSLAQDMKKEYEPSSLSKVLSSLRKA